jgi:NitT/TauT family transport system substrate-binding protein
MIKTTRRAALSMFAATAIGLVATAGLSTAAQAADAIKIGILSLTSHSPSIIAEGKGYFTEQDLAVEFVSFQAAQPMAVAIASGDVDMGVTAISAGLISLAEKDVIRVIGGALQEEPGISGQKILVSKAAHDAGVTTPADLAGRRFGLTTAGSSFHYMAHKIADGAGIARDSIELVPMQGVPAVIAALRSGQIDAWSIVPNIATGLVGSGDVVQIGEVSDFISDYQVTAVFTSKANVEDRRDVVDRFLTAFSRGIDDYNAALVDGTADDAEVEALIDIIHTYVYTDRPRDRAASAIKAFGMRINPQAAMNLASIRDQLDWFQSERLVPEGVTMDLLVDTSFVETF